MRNTPKNQPGSFSSFPVVTACLNATAPMIHQWDTSSSHEACWLSLSELNNVTPALAMKREEAKGVAVIVNETKNKQKIV